MFDDSEPEHENRAILPRNASAILLASITAIILMVLLILSGMFDPKPVGVLTESFQPGVVSGQRWLTTVSKPFSVQMMIASAERESAILYGSPDDHIAIAIGSDGYLAIWHTSPDGIDYLYPWQTWVHVNSIENEIWLDVEANRWTIRINRELFYEGVPLLTLPRKELGVMGRVSAEISVIEIYQP